MAAGIDAAANGLGNPVVFVLGSYASAVWDIKWAADARIIAVFASGNHRQAIARLDKSVPRLISTYDSAGWCGS